MDVRPVKSWRSILIQNEVAGKIAELEFDFRFL